ncbi:MAG: lamin tail domain-containing protein [bacterium]
MKFIRKSLPVIFLFLWLPGGYAVEPGEIVINELMWMGSTASTSDEWIELRNMTGQDIDLSSWNITRLNTAQEELMLTIPQGKTIPAGGYFLISNYKATDSNSRINVEPDVVNTAVSLANDKLQIKIYDGAWNNGARLIDTADDGSGDPLAGDNINKCSMERRDPPGDGTAAVNWQTSSDSVNWDSGATEKGTPKTPNSVDLSPPPAISDLNAIWGNKDGEIVLTWTAPSEDTSGGGKVNFYEVKYAAFSFNEDSWNSAGVIKIADVPTPKLPGEKESLTITNLKAGIIYYFAIKSADNEGQISSLDQKSADNKQAFCVARGLIKIKITEVSFASGNDWVELYNWGSEEVDISHFMLTDLDGTDSALAAEPVTLKPAQYAVIHWDDTGVDETDRTGDTNGDGCIDLYVSDTDLSSTDDEVVLMTAAVSGDYIDAVCWSNLDGVYDNTDLKLLAEKGVWAAVSLIESDAWSNSKEVVNEAVIGRKPSLYEDTNSKNDWYLYPTPTPGTENLFIQITEPQDGIIIEQSKNTRFISDIYLGEVTSVEFKYRKKGARNWISAAKKNEAPFNTSWDTSKLEIGSYELQLLANGEVYSAIGLVTLIKSENPRTKISRMPDVLVNTKSVIFEFSGEDNLTPPEKLKFIYKLDDNAWQNIGLSTQVVLGNLSEGPHNFTVKAVDEADYEDGTAPVYTFTVDTLAPEIFIMMPAEGDRLAGNAVPIITKFADTDIAKIIFQYRFPEGDWQDIQTVTEDPFQIFWDVSSLSDKPAYQLRVKATDEAGNIKDEVEFLSMVIDLAAPTYGGNKMLINPQAGGLITAFDGTTVYIPAGGLTGTEPVEISLLKLKPAVLVQSRHNNIKSTGWAKEFLLSNGQSILESGKSAEITFYYPEDALEDIKEDSLRLFWWDEEGLDWKLIDNSRVYPAEDCVRAQITHFSIYQIMGYTPDSGVNSAYVFPNPCDYSRDKKVKFARISESIKDIFIYNLSGELLRKITPDSADLNNVYWNCDNDSGNAVASGVYLGVIKTDDGQKIIKIAVIK